jgi:hypothetical protein
MFAPLRRGYTGRRGTGRAPTTPPGEARKNLTTTACAYTARRRVNRSEGFKSRLHSAARKNGERKIERKDYDRNAAEADYDGRRYPRSQ